MAHRVKCRQERNRGGERSLFCSGAELLVLIKYSFRQDSMKCIRTTHLLIPAWNQPWAVESAFTKSGKTDVVSSLRKHADAASESQQTGLESKRQGRTKATVVYFAVASPRILWIQHLQKLNERMTMGYLWRLDLRDSASVTGHYLLSFQILYQQHTLALPQVRPLAYPAQQQYL